MFFFEKLKWSGLNGAVNLCYLRWSTGLLSIQ